VYSNITIIGLGTIGGFLAKNFSELESIKKLVIIDYDVVENSNLKNSIYKKTDVGKFKVDCLYNIVNKINNDLEIVKIKDKYIEGITKIPKCDLVIDCRDFTYDRGSEIDIRLYISSRYLIIDCRKDMIYQIHYEGKYIDNLTKEDISSAMFNASMFISTGLIKEFINKKIVHKIELDYLKKSSYERLDEYNNKLEIVLDHHEGAEKFINFFENAERLIELNKKFELNVCLGDKNYPLAKKIIPVNENQNVNELTKKFLSFINLPYNFNNYIISLVIEKKECYVILIPETGAA